MSKKRKTKYTAALIAVSAMFAALIVGGKQALAVVPNVEVVTLLIALCAYVWGVGVALPAVNVFIAVEMAIWGVNTWVFTYLIHFNTVAICYCALGKLSFKRRGTEVLVATFAATLLTTLFGVLSSVVDTLIGYTGKGFFVDGHDFFTRFAVMYAAGWLPPYVFNGVHVLCNLLLFSVAFVPLAALNRKAKLRLAPQEQPPSE